MRAERRAELEAELGELAKTDRLRQRPVIDGPDGRVIALRGGPGGRQRLLNWGSNDYLGCIGRIKVGNGARRRLRQHGPGAGAARLLAGGLSCHRNLERALARFLGSEDVLLTSSGYQANLAVLPALADRRGDAVLLDRLCHASAYDAARLSAGSLRRFAHNDLDDLADKLRACADARRRLVVVESVYSMDGDEAPLAAIAACCVEHDAWLIVDEAHAVGVLGPGGRGGCAAAGIVPDVLVGTCSKSLGAQGGFIAGDQALVDLIVNRGRSFIFSTAPVPAAVGAAEEALRFLQDEPEAGASLLAQAEELRRALSGQGWEVPAGRTPIIPVITGSEERTLALAAALRRRGHYAPAVRPPTVPAGGCRLRLTCTLAHRPADRRRLIRSLAELVDAAV